MTQDMIDQLNARFALPKRLAFVNGPGGLGLAEIHNDYAIAQVALQGAHVVTYQPHGQAPVLFVSRQALYQPGRAIRGGIPVCWPWFAAHPTDPSKPFHGFARSRLWQVAGSAQYPNGATELRLQLLPDAETRAIWPYEFVLELAIRVGERLELTLSSHNTGDLPFVVGGAFHSYFTIGDIATVRIHGLDDSRYLDKVADVEQIQQGPVLIDGEHDAVYQATDATCEIDDPTLGRRIRVSKQGSYTTVIWNPGPQKARDLADLADDEYRTMVCVETANALDDVVTLEPGGEHQLVALIDL